MFGNPRLIDRKRICMHYYPNIYAERSFRVSLGMIELPADMIRSTRQATWEFARRAHAEFAELHGFACIRQTIARRVLIEQCLPCRWMWKSEQAESRLPHYEILLQSTFASEERCDGQTSLIARLGSIQSGRFEGT